MVSFFQSVFGNFQRATASLVVFLIVFSFSVQAQAAIERDLALCIDMSNSMDNTELNTQLQGTSHALDVLLPTDSTVRISIFLFGTSVQPLDLNPSTGGTQSTRIVDSTTAKNNIVAAVSGATRSGVQFTNTGACIEAATAALQQAGAEDAVKIIDISTDGIPTVNSSGGTCNDGCAAANNYAISAANAAGMDDDPHSPVDVLNVIVVGNDIVTTTMNAIAYPKPVGSHPTDGDGFVFIVDDFLQFRPAIATKVATELSLTTLSLKKTVRNDDGGSADVDDFSITTSAGALTWGNGIVRDDETDYYTDPIVVEPGTFTLVEANAPGYVEGAWECDAGTDLVSTFSAGSITLAAEDVVTCSILNDDSVAQVNPAIEIVKDGVLDIAATAPAGSLNAGDKINYTFTVTNTGDVQLTNVSVTDNVVASISCTPEANPIATLAPTEEVECTGSYTVTQADINSGKRDNTATATGKPPQGDNVSDTSDHSQPLAQVKTLKLVKTADPKYYSQVGEVVEYSYELENTGNVTLYPPYTVADDKSDDESCPGTPATLLPGGKVTCTASYEIEAGDITAGSVTNVATGSARDAASNGQAVNSNQDQETVTLVRVNLAKAVNGPAILQNDGTYNVAFTVTATNQGNGPATYDIVDTFSPGTSITLNSAVAQYIDGDGQDVTVGSYPTFVTGEGLGAGLVERWLVTANFTVAPAVVSAESSQCDDSDPEINTGFYNRVSGSDSDNDASDNDSCTGVPPASLDLSKTITEVLATGQDTWQVTYVITATNGGDGAAVYDVLDNLDPGAGITATTPPTVTYVPINDLFASPVTTPSGWSLISEDETLAGGRSESWRVVVEFSLDRDTEDFLDTLECQENKSGLESGRGFFNEVVAVAGESNTQNNRACATPQILVIDAASSCNADAPWVQYTVTPYGFAQAPTQMTYSWIHRNGNTDTVVAGPVQTTSFSQSILWPGADVAAGGNGTKEPGDAPTSWPAWTEAPEGVWTFDSNSLLVPKLFLQVQVNPTIEVELTYPSQTKDCVAAPPAELTVSKQVEQFLSNADGTFDVTYRINVVNTGGRSETYSLFENLKVADALTPVAILTPLTYIEIDDGPVATGVLNSITPQQVSSGIQVLTGESIGINRQDSFVVKIRFEFDDHSAILEQLQCLPSVEASGFTNEIALIVDGQVVRESVACVDIPPRERRATFRVVKEYSDMNPADVQVTLSCNTGLVLTQSKSLSPGEDEYVEFVMVEFDSGEMECSITEAPVAGYTALYSAMGDSVIDNESTCTFDQVFSFDENVCHIFNQLQPVTVGVNKVWLDDHPEYGLPMYARAEYECFGEADSQDADAPAADQQGLTFEGQNAYDSFEVLPHWNGETWCRVMEILDDDSIEGDDSDCASVAVHVDDDEAECTIYNTRFFEGIPTLNEYGFALLMLLMLGVATLEMRRRV